MSVLLTLGHGYSAAVLAASLPNWQVFGTTRSATGAQTLRNAGFGAIPWDDDVALQAAVAAADAVLVSIPPDAEGDPALRRLDALLGDFGRARWIGYLSTTGVYGDHHGNWVSETTPARPAGIRGHWRVAAEAAWLNTGLPVHIFRLAGIYGPGRSAFDRLREGRAQRIVKPGQVFSRIHVADIAATLCASLVRPNPGRIYNLADDEPCPPQDVIAYAASLLGMVPPPEIPFDIADLTPMARSFYAESKRVSNQRLKDELGIRLAYPDYRAGLRAILAAGG